MTYSSHDTDERLMQYKEAQNELVQNYTTYHLR